MMKLLRPISLAVDGAHSFVGDLHGRCIVEVLRGEVSLLSGQGRGAGPMLSAPIALDVDGARILCIDLGCFALLSVDRTSGDRTLRSDFTDETLGPIPLSPLGVASNGDRAIVLDRGHRAVLEVDLHTGRRRFFSGPDEQPPLHSPLGISRTQGGFLLIDPDQKAVLELDQQGRRRLLHQGAPLIEPTGAARASDKRLMIIDLGAQTLFVDGEPAKAIAGLPMAGREAGGGIAYLDLATPTLHRPDHVTELGPASSLFQQPYGVAAGSEGEIIVIDRGHKALSRISPDGALLQRLSLPGLAISGVTLADGRFILADYQNQRLVEQPFDGRPPRLLSGQGRGAGPALGGALGLAEIEGQLAVLDQGPEGRRVLLVDLDSGDRRLLVKDLGLSKAYILRAHAGGLITCCMGARMVVSIDLDGRVTPLSTDEHRGPKLLRPLGIDSREGQIVIADFALNAVLSVGPDGHRRILSDRRHSGVPLTMVCGVGWVGGRLYGTDLTQGQLFSIGVDGARHPLLRPER